MHTKIQQTNKKNTKVVRGKLIPPINFERNQGNEVEPYQNDYVSQKHCKTSTVFRVPF